MKAKQFFFIFVGISLLPLAAAYFVLKLGWFNSGEAVKGQFLDSEINITLTQQKPMWHLVYQPNGDCDALCEEQLYGLEHVYTALGRKQSRVNAWVMGTAELKNDANVTYTKQRFDLLEPEYIYIVDPEGKVILRYLGSTDRHQTIATGKAILADLKRLLNYARVG